MRSEKWLHRNHQPSSKVRMYVPLPFLQAIIGLLVTNLPHIWNKSFPNMSELILQQVVVLIIEWQLVHSEYLQCSWVLLLQTSCRTLLWTAFEFPLVPEYPKVGKQLHLLQEHKKVRQILKNNDWWIHFLSTYNSWRCIDKCRYRRDQIGRTLLAVFNQFHSLKE